MSIRLAFVTLLSLLGPASALAAAQLATPVGTGAPPTQGKPATTLRIPQTTDFRPPGESSWFVRSDLNLDLPFKGAAGVGASVGHFERFYFLDFSFMYYGTSYGAIRMDHPDSETPGANTETARLRADAEKGSIFTVGPGVGFAFKLFDSDHWVEMGRFGLNYAQFSDQTRGMAMRGALANFNASIGYQFSQFVIAPGVTWNLGFFENTAVPADPAVSHKNYLPLQWWAWQIALYWWL